MKQTMLKSKKLTPDVDGVENALVAGGGTTRNSGQGHWFAKVISKRHLSLFKSQCTRKALSKKKRIWKEKKDVNSQSITLEKKNRKQSKKKKKAEANVIMGHELPREVVAVNK